MPLPELEHTFDSWCCNCDERLAQYRIERLIGGVKSPPRFFCHRCADRAYNAGPVYILDDATKAHARRVERSERAYKAHQVYEAFDELLYSSKSVDTGVGVMLDCLERLKGEALEAASKRRQALAFHRPVDAQERSRKAYCYAENMVEAIAKALEAIREATAHDSCED